MKQIQYPLLRSWRQERLKNALIFNLICPGIGGVLATAVRKGRLNPLWCNLGAVSR